MKSYKSFAFSCRMDIRKFASLTEFLRRQGLLELSQSSVTRALLEMLYTHLDNTDPDFRIFDDAVSARDYLEKVGIFIGKKNRAYQNFVRQVQQEALLDDFGSDAYLNPNSPTEVDSCELGDAMKALQRKAEERDDEFRELQKELAKGGKSNEKGSEIQRPNEPSEEGD